jgi:hypothetical protein
VSFDDELISVKRQGKRREDNNNKRWNEIIFFVCWLHHNQVQVDVSHNSLCQTATNICSLFSQQ